MQIKQKNIKVRVEISARGQKNKQNQRKQKFYLFFSLGKLI